MEAVNRSWKVELTNIHKPHPIVNRKHNMSCCDFMLASGYMPNLRILHPKSQLNNSMSEMFINRTRILVEKNQQYEGHVILVVVTNTIFNIVIGC